MMTRRRRRLRQWGCRIPGPSPRRYVPGQPNPIQSQLYGDYRWAGVCDDMVGGLAFTAHLGSFESILLPVSELLRKIYMLVAAPRI
jgi:hypothetical protein